MAASTMVYSDWLEVPGVVMGTQAYSYCLDVETSGGSYILFGSGSNVAWLPVEVAWRRVRGEGGRERRGWVCF